MNFSKRPNRKGFIDDDPLKRLEYDNDKIIAGFDTLKALKIKGAVKFDNHSIRDNGMYNFDKNDILEL